MTLSKGVLEAVKKLNIPAYKLAVQSVIGEMNGQGIRVCSKSLWDSQNDNFTTYEYKNEKIFCAIMVFGYYFE